MSKRERKPSYTDRLIKHLCESEDLEDLDLKPVVDCIREFSKSVAKQIKQEENANPDTLPFGKYKGKRIEDIHKIDSKYLVWLRRQSFLKDNLKEALDEVLTSD